MSPYENMIANAVKIHKNTGINQAIGRNSLKSAGANNHTGSFTDVLNGLLDETKDLQFSKHAEIRLSNRDIALSDEQIKRVEGGVAQAVQKGINHSLVLVDNVALLVNVPSKTVVTAMDQKSQNVFTNIDGTVIV